MVSGQASPVMRFLRRIAGTPAAGDLDDRHLLERFVTDRDPAAFAALVERHGPMVQGVCRRVLHDDHAAEDAFQATFLVLVHKARSLGRPELLGNWLYGVAYRTAVRARDAAARRRAREREMTDMPGNDSTVEVVWRDLRGVLDEELGRLAQRYRVPLVLFYLEGKSTEEVAHQLGCPKGTVQSRLARGRDQLRERLVRRGVALTVWALALALAEKAAPAVVPAALVEGTVQAAVLTAAGTAAGAIPAGVAALTKGVLRAMLLNKSKVVVAVVLAVTVAVAGTALCVRQALADKSAAAGKDEAPKDEEKVLGTWAVVSYEEGGQKAPEEAIKEARVIFAADGKMTAKLGAKEQEFTYKLDPAKKPKEFSGTNDKGQAVLGIYKLDRDALTICCNRGGDRPTEFASKEGTTVVLEVLKREKK
jgi:RNA polymerase sigma factor (sigma-70 family)